MSTFEYIFTPDDRRDGSADAPRIIEATSVEDAIQILFLSVLEARRVAGTIRVRRWRSRERWMVRRYEPPGTTRRHR